jgi:hypothetical protein
MASISNFPTLSWIDLYASDTTVPSGNQLGMLAVGPDGKGYRYALAGVSALTVGNVLQSSAVDTTHTNMAVPAVVTLGSTTVTVTNGTDVVVAGDLVGGTLSVYTTPGLGEEYTIVGNSAATSGSALTLYIDRPLRTAWTTATKVNVLHSPWWKVIAGVGGTLTGTCPGVAIYAIPAGAYGWIQTKGVSAVLSDNTSILVGSALMPSATAAGSAALHLAGFPVIGQAMQAAASTHVIAATLSID